MPKFYFNVSQLGDNIYVRENNSNGEVKFKNKFQPRLFIPSNKSHKKFKSIKGRPLEEINPGSIYECKDFLKEYKDVDGFEIYGNTNFAIQYISENYKNLETPNLSLIHTGNFDIEVGCDEGFPKPEFAKYPITAITVIDSITGIYNSWGLGSWSPKKSILKKELIDNVVYKGFDNEIDMLNDFLSYWEKKEFYVITGWNIDGFDIPYLVNRIKKIMSVKAARRLSPWGIIKDRRIRNDFGQQIDTYELMGISSLDYLTLYKNYTYNAQESYTLDHISYIELKERKLSYDEVGSLYGLYKTNFQKYIDYNIKDVNLVKRIDDKMKLLDLVFTVAYYAKINFQDVNSPVRTWDTIIYNYLLERNTIVPPSRFHKKKGSYAGAYVKDPLVGHHRWVMSFDLRSLYPHLIMQYNLGPDTIIDKDDLPEDLYELDNTVKVEEEINGNRYVDKRLVNKEINTDALRKHNICLSANNQYFKTDKKSFLSIMMDDLYKLRKINKNKVLDYQQKLVDLDGENKDLKNKISKFDNLQKAQKILLNSAYGGIGTPYFRFYDVRIAEAITVSGQLSIKWIANRLNSYLNKILGSKDKDYVVAVDTDSNYIVFSDLIDSVFKDQNDKEKIVNFLDKISNEKIKPYIQNCYNELSEYMNAKENKMFMEREVIADSAIWTGKKRYILNVWDSEGVRYKEPKMKIMGLEAKKSSTPEICRKKLKEAYKMSLNGSEEQLIEFIDKFKKEWVLLPADKIAFPRSVNSLNKWKSELSIFKKGTPINSKGSLIFNYLVKKKKLENKIPLINEGEKIKYVLLKIPNPTGSGVIAFNGFLPKELSIDKYIDYDIMFDKAFIKPLICVLDSVGWTVEKKVTLPDFFV